MTTDPVSATPNIVSTERGRELLEKWFPILCSDSEYKERYGVDRPHMSTAIILEGQESWMVQKPISNASVAQ